MGIEIKKRVFEPRDHAAFAARVDAQLDVLRVLLAKPGFGEGPPSLGSELELYLVDAEGAPAYLNQEILAAAEDPQLTLELNRYNLEYNLSPVVIADDGFAATEHEMLAKLEGLRAVAGRFGVEPVPIGILPTLTQGDFGLASMTDRLRYHALVEQLVLERGSEFEIAIDGVEPLQLAMKDITLEGANTSFQVHWRVDPAAYARIFNAVQLVTPLVLAISSNSPGIFGRQLWDETRIPLFKQSIDTRHNDPRNWHEPSRVGFGQGWVRDGALELFSESVRLFKPLLPVMDECEQETSRAVPELAELRLHQSTVWCWNRPVYDDAAGGHLRIELRALPAGPTPVDMVAGAAFAIGLARTLSEQIDALLPGLPFPLAERNFYRCAQLGVDADIIWPSRGQHALQMRPVVDVVTALLPQAADGLAALGVDAALSDRYLGVIEQRCRQRQTGARWQRTVMAQREQAGESRAEALHGMFASYRELSATNEPVGEWPLA